MHTASLGEMLTKRDNDHRSEVVAFEARSGLAWHAESPPTAASGTLSVIIPARDTAYSLPAVLDALAAQATNAEVETILIDDSSTDATPEIAASHPVVNRAVRLPRAVGCGIARNVGTYIAHGDTIIYLDADMVLPNHVISDFAARANDHLVLVGFRHDVPYRQGPHDEVQLPAGEPDLECDHRVRYVVPAGMRAFWSGRIYPETFVCRTLDVTHDFRDLGNGADYHGWRLPNMVSPDLMCVSRRAVLKVGGFDPRFGVGWGFEDTYLVALLIAAGCKVVPLRQCRAFHIDPPNPTAAAWSKQATGLSRSALYRSLLKAPVPCGQQTMFTKVATELLVESRILR